MFAHAEVDICRVHPGSEAKRQAIDGFFAWDGYWYEQIAETGYQNKVSGMSGIAFYPAYPLAARAVTVATGISTRWALLIVSNLAFLTAMVVFARRGAVNSAEFSAALLSLALFPTTFWMRMAYSESMCLLSLLAAMWAVRERKPIWVCAVLAGACPLVRSVGVAMGPVVVFEIWRRWREQRFQVSQTRGVLDAPRHGSRSLNDAAGEAEGARGRPAIWRPLLSTLLWAPVCVWGLLAFMAWQWSAFGSPVAFVTAQKAWQFRPLPPLGQRIVDELTFKPVSDVYDPACTICYWGSRPPAGKWYVNMVFLNSVYFFLTVGLVWLGWWKGWLTSSEVLLAVGLLAVPYFSQGYKNCMSSMARYSSVVYPQYLVLGKLLSRCPAWLATPIFAACGGLLAIYSGLFANWYWFF